MREEAAVCTIRGLRPNTSTTVQLQDPQEYGESHRNCKYRVFNFHI